MGSMSFSMSAKSANRGQLEPLHYLKPLTRRAPEYAFKADSRREWKRWRTSLRKKLAEAISLPRIERCSPRITKGPVAKCKGYVRHALTIETSPGLYVPAFLLVPAGCALPRPAVLCCHGHGYGMNALVALTEDGRPRRIGTGYQRDFAIQAVRAGFVTLAFDQYGFGRRRDFAFNKTQRLWNACEQPSKNALHFGLTVAGIRVWDACRMIDVLQSRSEVIADRIGMVGISGGGMVTQFAAALDERVRAACVSGYCNRYADCILAIRHCIDNYVPGLGLLAENDDIACLIAPKSLLIESGTKDPIFPIAATRSAIRKLRRCYKLLDAADAFETDIFEGDHHFHGAKVWKFFARNLGAPHV